MPWTETSAMRERSAFIVEYRGGLYSFRALCKKYGISRKTGYKFLSVRGRRPRRAAGPLSAPCYCYPLTLLDGFSGYLLACKGLPHPTHDGVYHTLDRTFHIYGLPAIIRSDNGAPFASQAIRRVSSLAVWWIRLGITPELIEPSHPEQNGRHERFRRTLKAETTRPSRANLRCQQRRFDAFRAEYNHERPHRALAGRSPAMLHRKLRRQRFDHSPSLLRELFAESLTVAANGFSRLSCDRMPRFGFAGFRSHRCRV